MIKKAFLKRIFCRKKAALFIAALFLATNLNVYVFASNRNLAYQPKKIAYADTEYARILNEQTPFYSDPGCQMLKFYLPFSYYVRVVKLGSDCIRVAYMENATAPAREGYIKTCDFFPCDYAPENPYPAVNLSLKSDEVLFSTPQADDPRVVLPAGEQACFYGSIDLGGEVFYYVYSGAYVGYVRKRAFSEHVIPNHPNPLPKEEEPIEGQPESARPSEQEKQNNENSGLSAVIIAIVAVVSVCVIYLLFRPESRAIKKAAYSDDD